MTRAGLLGSFVLLLVGGPAPAQEPTARAKPDPSISPAATVAAPQVSAPPVSAPPVSAAPVLPSGSFTAPASSRFWFGTDYLMWWSKSSPAPPLAAVGTVTPPSGPVSTTAPLPGTPFLGLLTLTSVPNPLAGPVTFGNDLRSGPQPGLRVTLGGWLDREQVLGLEGSYLLLATNPAHFDATSSGTPAVAIPLLNPLTGLASSYPIAQPATTQTTMQFVNTAPGVFVRLFTRTITDAANGQLAERNGSSLQGGELNAMWNPVRASNWRLQGLAGVRFLQLDETLRIDSNVNRARVDTADFEPALGVAGGPLTSTLTANTLRSDVFATRNGFYGGQVGTLGEYRVGRWSLLGGAKIAVGEMHQIVQIDGSTTTTASTTATPATNILLAGIPLMVPVAGAANVTTTTAGTTAGGLFAQPGNLGHYHRDVLAFVPEANFRVAYRLTSRLTASVGYTFLYINDVARPAALVDRNVDPTLLTAPPGVPMSRPTLVLRGSDYWAQGLDFGLRYQY